MELIYIVLGGKSQVIILFFFNLLSILIFDLLLSVVKVLFMGCCLISFMPTIFICEIVALT